MQIADNVIALFLVLCRVGACFMIVPGLSSARVPARVRLYLAVGIALVIVPIIEMGGRGRGDVPNLAYGLFSECVIGAFLGFTSRLLIEAVEFFATAISNYIGLNAISGIQEAAEMHTSVSSLMSIFAVTLLMLLDFPQHLVVGLIESYSVMPLLTPPPIDVQFGHFTGMLQTMFRVSLQISAPFLLYGIIGNLAFALLGKLVPQFQSFAVSGPFIVLGGLALLYISIGEISHVLIDAFALSIWRR